MRVHVGPKAPEPLVEAVRGAGAAIVPADEAEALVWFGGPADELRTYLHPGVRWVQLPSAGVESYLAAGVLTGDRVFTSAAGCYAHSVAEHTLAMMLAAARRLPELARARTWTSPEPVSLRGARVVIVGAGGIGQALIALLGPFDADIVAITRSGRAVPGARVCTTPDRLHDVLADADFVVVAAPSTARTSALVGARELALMPSTAWLVNVARGTLVDTDAVVAALRSGEIGGAALDVTDPEPLPDGHPLWSERRALITPHSANPLSLRLPRLAERVGHNTARFARGEPLEGVVDPSAGY
ncbi:D-isomer specific 2-hydroxyacid dehydrogenase family protein [Haloactinopolyspora alba]|uniref:D-isomer specific 2-hydroxyacid dehydrogenase family protein n=1 Tax=Haloactinopolyspora alba TaxID=648780 RepID=UPI000D0D0309